MEIHTILEKITKTFGESLIETICSLLPEGCDVQQSSLGNIIVRFPGENSDEILIDAHMDTVHFRVTAITSDGFLKVAPCGGVDCRVLSGGEVIVWSNEPLFGLFTITPPHLKGGASTPAASVEKQSVDIGLSFEETMKKVNIGDVVTFTSPFVRLNQQKVVSRGLDNLAGVAVLISLSHKLSKMNLKNTVTLQFSNYEETGHRFAGGVTGAFAVSPKEAIVVDASFAKAPGLRYPTPGKLGEGVMIGVSPMLSKRISDTLIKTANQNGIGYTAEILGGSSGTNADGIVSVGGGIPTGLVSYPLLNMHTAVETVSEKDLTDLLKLLETYCRKGGSFYGE